MKINKNAYLFTYNKILAGRDSTMENGLLIIDLMKNRIYLLKDINQIMIGNIEVNTRISENINQLMRNTNDQENENKREILRINDIEILRHYFSKKVKIGKMTDI